MAWNVQEDSNALRNLGGKISFLSVFCVQQCKYRKIIKTDIWVTVRDGC